ncbi:MAG: bifunctional folylpolyglutamate synthase/dihydrofolate synthase [Pyrinomonadaceae bacterium]|nr:bifunctional folylpolyglutamate synthase/dihydrofolate synthase [Pyrinomonadaceae bacterium]
MNFDESLSYLYGLGNEVLAMKLGLENIRKLIAALGNPEKNYLKVQIAGTNGKGSTAAFLEAICVSAGLKTGSMTSPHLVSITERIKINGREISEKDFARHATIIKETSEKLIEKGELETVPTFFEQITAIALNAFSEAKIELAILETGLGGRFDAVTAANAEIVAITPIDYDHQQILGETLALIAAEKASIIRRKTKVIIAPQKREAERIIIGKCREKEVDPVWAATDYKIKKGSADFEYELHGTIKTKNDNYPNVSLGLLGRHQFENASVAVSIAETLREFNFDISQNSIIHGLETARHGGRLEFYKGILFDGAHNAAGAKALRQYLDEFIHQPITIVFGAMNDKDLSEIGEILFPKAEKLIFTKPDNPRSMEIAELLKFVPMDFNKENLILTETVEQAIEKAKEISLKNQLILVTGSLYLVGEAQKLLKSKSEI